MSIARPIFADGAILAANDLSTLESIGRDRDARHARLLHTPGVAVGLQLRTESRTTTPGGAAYVDVILGKGAAYDSGGRELVLAADLPLSPDSFLNQNLRPTLEPGPGQTITVWHPVFIRGLDTPVNSNTTALGCQGRGGGGRVVEEIEVEFGRPGDASASQPVPEPDAGPGDGVGRVLVGFVRFDTAIGQFASASPSAGGVTVAGAGARAGLVAGQFDRVELRARATPDSGVPALILDSAPGPSLTFGTHTGSGTVAPLMAIDAGGNMEIQGAINAKGGTAGTVRMVGGSAFDGTVLPLPAGVDQAKVDSGDIELVIHVTPRLPTQGPGPLLTLALPLECRVDADRRVHCFGFFLGAMFGLSAMSCDYVVLAAVPGGA
jgi:hypothetical protein